MREKVERATRNCKECGEPFEAMAQGGRQLPLYCNKCVAKEVGQNNMMQSCLTANGHFTNRRTGSGADNG